MGHERSGAEHLADSPPGRPAVSVILPERDMLAASDEQLAPRVEGWTPRPPKPAPQRARDLGAMGTDDPLRVCRVSLARIGLRNQLLLAEILLVFCTPRPAGVADDG